MQLSKLVFLFVFSFLLLTNQTSLAQDTTSERRALVSELKAYGRCVDAQHRVSQIKNSEDLTKANSACEKHLSKIEQISPSVASQLKQHMRSQVQIKAGQQSAVSN